MEALLAVLRDAIGSCTEMGLFAPALSGSRLEQVARLLMLSHTGWAQHNATWPDSYFISVGEMMETQWAVLMPYLTPAGQAAYAALTQRTEI